VVIDREGEVLIEETPAVDVSLLTVLTIKIRPSKPRVRKKYTTSFMHIVDTNKVPRVVLQFVRTGTHLGRKGTNVTQ
jgi:hypothetical protein